MSATAKTVATDARVVEGAMIASFMGAEPPKVWRADMKNLATATFEMRHADGLFHVVMTSGTGQENIAAFTDKEGATNALQALMAAMMTPQGTATPAAGTAAAAGTDKKPGSAFGRFIKGLLKLVGWIVGLVIVFALLSMLFAPNLARLLSDPGLTKVQQGAPIPADELFGE